MGETGDDELRRKIEEYRARERVYLAGLTEQEGDMSRLRAMAADVLGAYGDRSRAAVRGALSFPTANMEVSLLRQKIREQDQQIVLLKEELEANRFDQHAPAGQALMRKCKALLTENRELGEEMREERFDDLRAALQAEKLRNDGLYQKVNDASEFCKELSDENIKLQGTIARVAGMLRDSRSELDRLVKERADAKKRRKLEKEAKALAASMKAQAQASTSAFEVEKEDADVDVGEDVAVGAGQESPQPEVPAAAAAAAAPIGAGIEVAERPAGAEKDKKKKKDKKDKSRKRKADDLDPAND